MLYSTVSYEKNKQVQQANSCRSKHYCFIFRRIVEICLTIYPQSKTYEVTAGIIESVSKHNGGQVVTHQQHFLKLRQISYIEHVLLVSYKYLHLRVWYLHKVFLPSENEKQETVPYRILSTAISHYVYLHMTSQ